MNKLIDIKVLLAAAFLLPTTACFDGVEDTDPGVEEDRGKNKAEKINTGSRSLHLQDNYNYDPENPDADVARGQAAFGIMDDGVSGNNPEGLFEGESIVFGNGQPAQVTSNGRTCFSCHRPEFDFGLPDLPLNENGVEDDDPVLTGISGDAGDDPDAFFNQNNLGLSKIRFNRLDYRLSPDDDRKRVFAWRKSPQLLNIGLTHGWLNDARGRVFFEIARGAVFTHTQVTDNRFDDIIQARRSDFDDMEAFLFDQYTDPLLEQLRDPNAPLHQQLIDKPFMTVDMKAGNPTKKIKKMRKKGKKLFKKQCMSCHNASNVFNNTSNAEGTGNGMRPEDNAPLGPSVARTFNVGVAERNAHGLRFTHYDTDGEGNAVYSPITIALINEDGSTVDFEVTHDPGLAATTARAEDLGRMKVPQLRNLAANAPYFHDNSAATIEEVVDYFNSADYNDSADGQDHPVNLSPKQRDQMVEFLKIL